jgi:hypothetical protein
VLMEKVSECLVWEEKRNYFVESPIFSWQHMWFHELIRSSPVHYRSSIRWGIMCRAIVSMWSQVCSLSISIFVSHGSENLSLIETAIHFCPHDALRMRASPYFLGQDWEMWCRTRKENICKYFVRNISP